jgi:hypothetical protein
MVLAGIFTATGGSGLVAQPGIEMLINRIRESR